MANSTLGNLSKSSYVRTDPILATRIKNLLRFPDTCSVWDPTSGTGSLFYACPSVPGVRKYGTEISEERASESRETWPSATILTTAFEAVHVEGMTDLLLINPPYMLMNGKRASLSILSEAGDHLRPGGVNASILSALSDWDGTMINHWLKWYDEIRVWKFPDRTKEDQEGAFDDYHQILIVGIRREMPATITTAEKKRLQGYQWKHPEKEGQSGWRYGEVPPDLPEHPIESPYQIPGSPGRLRLSIWHANEGTLLQSLKTSGVHLSPAWQKAVTWPEDGYLSAPAMPYTGEAHIAAEVMVGGLDGELVYGPGPGKDAVPHLFTAFVGQEWYKKVVEDEVKQKLAAQGCVRVEMRELNDKPILGVLNLVKGTTHYYQGEAVFQFLRPWLQTLASRVVEKRKPLYRLDPADWELQVTSQFGLDKQLAKAPFPGLAVPQLHRVYAMGRALDVHGRVAIQGEPGTGKTRMATATAARQAYRWQQRTSEFQQATLPAWVRGLRRAWLKNPRTLAILGLEPVYGWRFNEQRKQPERKAEMLEKSPQPHIVAYREKATGRLIAPEEAGPKALPVLIATPLKVVKEYDKEIKAAYPQAEVIHIESHRDIPVWFERCATSAAPVVFGIVSHSAKAAFGRKWRPVVQEKETLTQIIDLDPPAKASLEVVHDERTQEIIGYRSKTTGKLLTREKKTLHFFCPDCKGRIDAIPGSQTEKEEKAPTKEKEKEKKEKTEPVGSKTWFIKKHRWCTCQKSRRNQDRVSKGNVPLRTPLWQDDRTEATRRKSPSCTFAQWSAAQHALSQEALRLYKGASTSSLSECVRRDRGLLPGLIEAAHGSEALFHLVERIDGEIAMLRAQITYKTNQLTRRLQELASCDAVWLEQLVQQTVEDEPLFLQVLERARIHEPALREQLPALIQERKQHADRLLALVAKSVVQDTGLLKQVIAVCGSSVDLYQFYPQLTARFDQMRGRLAMGRVLLIAAQRCETLLLSLLAQALHDPALSTLLCTQAESRQQEEELAQDQACLVGLVREVAREHPAFVGEILELVGAETTATAHLALSDLHSLMALMPSVAAHREEIEQLTQEIREAEREIEERVTQAVRQDASGLLLSRLIEETRAVVNWEPLFFRQAYEQARSIPTTKTKIVNVGVRTRLTVVEAGPISSETRDSTAAQGYDAIRDPSGKIVAYQLNGRHELAPIYSASSGHIVGYVTLATGKEVMAKTCYDFRTPPPDSFSPYDYLYRFYKKCIALTIVDESHNGRDKDADNSQALRQAMRAAQLRAMTSGTHYGGDIYDFYHYWFSFYPLFWLRLGFGWNDAEKALKHYGVVQEWTKEFESDARKGSGHTTTTVSTIAAPGISAKLIPALLEDLCYLTVLDVGAHMPPKIEIPKGLLMHDPVVEERLKQAKDAYLERVKQVQEIQMRSQEMQKQPANEEQLARVQGQQVLAEKALSIAQNTLDEVKAWAGERDLSGTYDGIVGILEEKARAGNPAARLALGTIPRWFAALPCDMAYEVYFTKRGDWGDKGEPQLVICTPTLTKEHVYPMEQWLNETVKAELAEHRTVMIYIEQVGRSMSKRLEWVLKQANIASWTLPHSVEPEDRQQAILDAFNVDKHNVVIVPYRLVNEGLNLHHLPNRRGVQTIIWYEQSMNLFMYLQASQRAWRLGADKEVRIYLPFYLGTAAHKKMRKLGGQSGAASAFAGEPAKGELIKSMGADQTTLARLAANLEEEDLFKDESTSVDDLTEIEAAFARRNNELKQALHEGRQWLGIKDTLPERVATWMAMHYPDLWALRPAMRYLPEQGIFLVGQGVQDVEETPVSEAPALASQPLAAIPIQEPTISSLNLPTPVETSFVSLVFGDEDDIRHTRKQRGARPRRTLPRLKHPVAIKDIPAEQVQAVPIKKTGAVVPAWWEMSGEEEGA